MSDWHARGNRPSRLLPAVLGLLVLGLVGCSGGAAATPGASTIGTPAPTASSNGGLSGTSEDDAVGPAGALRVEMYALKFHPGDISVAAGKVVFFLVNPSGKSTSAHAMAIGHRVGELLVASTTVLLGKSVTFTVTGLSAGRYTIWCPIDGHAAEGMVGSLTVR